jgi:hypothetical protein
MVKNPFPGVRLVGRSGLVGLLGERVSVVMLASFLRPALVSQLGLFFHLPLSLVLSPGECAGNGRHKEVVQVAIVSHLRVSCRSADKRRE